MADPFTIAAASIKTAIAAGATTAAAYTQGVVVFAAVTTANIAGAFAVNYLASKVAASGNRQSFADSGQDVVFRGGTVPLQVAYGEGKIGGQLIYANATRKRTSGRFTDELENARIVHVLNAYTLHPADEITAVHFNEDRITFTTPEEPNGDINNGTLVSRNPRGGVSGNLAQGGAIDKPGHEWHPVNAVQHGYAPSVEVFKRLGAYSLQHGIAWPRLVSSYTDWTSEHRLRGSSQIIFTFYRFQSEDVENEWGNIKFWNRTGLPQNSLAEGRWKEIYDPRKDISLGGTHHINDNRTWEWSPNPILHALDYDRFYWGLNNAANLGNPNHAVKPIARYNLADIIEEANICDILMSTPEGMQKQYMNFGAYSLGDSHRSNMERILDSAIGFRRKTGGRISFHCGHGPVNTAADPLLHFDSESYADFQYTDGFDRAKSFNQAKGIYTSKERNYNSRESKLVVDARALAADNGENLATTLRLPGCTDENQTQRILKYITRASNFRGKVELSGEWGWRLALPGGYVEISNVRYGFARKIFRVDSIAPSRDRNSLPYAITLSEYDASIYGDVTDYVDNVASVPDVRTARRPQISRQEPTGNALKRTYGTGGRDESGEASRIPLLDSSGNAAPPAPGVGGGNTAANLPAGFEYGLGQGAEDLAAWNDILVARDSFTYSMFYTPNSEGTESVSVWNDIFVSGNFLFQADQNRPYADQSVRFLYWSGTEFVEAGRSEAGGRVHIAAVATRDFGNLAFYVNGVEAATVDNWAYRMDAVLPTIGGLEPIATDQASVFCGPVSGEALEETIERPSHLPTALASTEVVTESPVVGDGTSSAPVTVPDDAMHEVKLAVLNEPQDGYLLAWNDAEQRMEWIPRFSVVALECPP